MSLALHEQFLHAVKRSERPLLVLRELAQADDFASAFGLAAVLKKLGKAADIVCAGGRSPDSLQFLKVALPVKGDLTNLRALTLHVDVTKAKVEELSYNVVGDELRIHVTPKNGFWTADDVKVATSAYRYDLLIVLGAADLKSLGSLFTHYADFLYNTPIINIDHGANNEHFGQTNIVDAGATSVSEVAHDLVKNVDDKLFDTDIATAFLTGMVAKTKSFRTPNVAPKTLSAASSLMGMGARREEVVEHLFRTRSVETLRLWGRALARLKADQKAGLVWTLLTRQDFANAGATEDALSDIVSELVTTAPEARVVAIFYEHAGGYVAVHLFAERPHDALQLGAPFKASGTRERARLVPTERDIVEAERAVIGHLRRFLSQTDDDVPALGNL
jgi:nanoRNase/pAp phosphatase (c-di-AMP/oligoRNAs hydrolase)